MQKVDKEVAKKIWELHNKGYSYNKIALELNLSVITIYKTVKKIKELLEKGEDWEKHFEIERKESTNKRSKYFYIAKYLVKKLPKDIVKKIFESYDKKT
jgi:orotate phosphoribosyltransferase-like protein